MNNEKMTLFKIVLFYDIPQVIVTRKGENYYVGFAIDEGELTLRYFMHNVHSMEALDAFLMGSISAEQIYRNASKFLISTYSFVDGEYSAEEITKDQINAEWLPSPDFYCPTADVTEA